MKFYVRDWGRPCGVEPKIFTDKSKADIDSGEPMQFYPSIEEFNTKFEAWLFIKKYNSKEIIKVIV